MDIRCPICLEPWDMDSLHEAISIDYVPKEYTNEEYATLYRNARKAFTLIGCAYMEYGEAAVTRSCELANREGRTMVSEIYDLLGDDMDGAAAMLEDAELMGLI